LKTCLPRNGLDGAGRFESLRVNQEILKTIMATIKSFRDLLVWKKAKEMAVISIRTFEKVNRPYSSALTSQMMRSVISVSSNIAEGFEREGNKEFAHFLSIAKGSNGEYQSQLEIGFECQYITKQEFEKLSSLSTQTGLMIKSLLKYLSECSYKGQKYKTNLEDPAEDYTRIISVNEMNTHTSIE
jgi:four helix bundle protein